MINLKTSFLIIGLLACSLSQAQLVNIESSRMHTDDDRFVLENNLNFSYNNNNGFSIFSIANSLGTQIKSKDLNKIYLLLGNYSLTRAEGQDFQNSWFLHFRFNYKLEWLFKTKAFRFESFVQSQYNELLAITSRNLIGAGLRWKAISIENAEHNAETKYFAWKKPKANFRMYLGYAYMYEEERSDAQDQRFYHHRNSSYLSLNFVSGNEAVEIINTVYYQPLLKDFSDYRISEQLQIRFKISETLSANGTYTYYFDSVTLENTSDYSSNLSFGLGLNL